MKWTIWGLIAVLVVLHQDSWNWNNGRLVFGFLPVGLAYHACLSVLCAIVWWLATRFAWPADVDESAPNGQEEAR